ncbi:2-succinyl-5-enolpyruvyl-6-hydroxy-3-cyclohexene-1-carboxylic-acid synthase [Photobacterium sp. SDRW27]|uniref:2-succinyl-5-enolpyruvyl-6-hydroxy-3- cyclohexene-1-carboxylic-acid synthase n=1 Tax=Photobacterium obscurum TaxID=2829490 RepID=UPI0022430E55|nr:2-succinyl-5-enolpyruvyl-6-hydroxy-3-cyclohexene-1-carboxylic-acid synthase [Photobacterium obscurum]MCW8328294.1 2-succinyl-5-enolpyruvyl-6-hydroxy-3-cyclohexene-1-carboxylic-acid synthase [Photobacterium obscurum]
MMKALPDTCVQLQYRAALNKLWAGLMLEELARLGVKHVCIAPGSRSTPLTLAADENEKLTLHTHFDERGLGFLALGIAKASQQPVAVVVTSGTAVANLLPAVAEAGLTGEKLVLLTSDRPVELIQCGANQAIRQQGIFSEHVTEFNDLPSPSLDISPNWLLTTIDAAMSQQSVRGGAVHFNCHYPEPLYGSDVDFSSYLTPLESWLNDGLPYTRHQQAGFGPVIIDTAAWQSMTEHKGIIIAGRMEPSELPAVQALAMKLGWPLLVDPQAGGSSDWAGYDVWLQNPHCQQQIEQAEVVLQFGARLVSKRLLQLIADHCWQQYWLIDPLSGRLDPSHRRSLRIQATVKSWADEASRLVSAFNHYGWADSLKQASATYFELLAARDNSLNEMTLAANLMQWLPQGSELFLGNSLIVRLLDMCGKLPQTATFANRGASGIDGLIATAAGVQKARKAPLLCLLGDTSLLYDLNSLALLKTITEPVVVLVTNNDGGAIFDLLPVPEQQKESLYRMPHGLEFRHAAAMFGLDYQCPQTLAEAEQACRLGLQHNGATLIEVKTPSGQSGELLKALFAEVKNATLL